MYSLSNLVERLFSRAKRIMTDHRKRMLPIHLEELLYVHYNKHLWDEKLILSNYIPEADTTPFVDDDSEVQQLL